MFVINMDCNEVNTRQNINLHVYQVNLAKYGKRVYHMAVEVFNELPYNLKEVINNTKKFRANLKDCFILSSIHSYSLYCYNGYKKMKM
jgi:hypothetical protein